MVYLSGGDEVYRKCLMTSEERRGSDVRERLHSAPDPAMPISTQFDNDHLLHVVNVSMEKAFAGDRESIHSCYLTCPRDCWDKHCIIQSCSALCDLIDCGLSGFSVHGILQARILEWFFPTPGDLPEPGIKSMSPALAGRFSTNWTTWKAQGSAFLKWENAGDSAVS